MNEITIEDFKKDIRKCWSKETCYELWQDNWSQALPEYGQCYVTTYLVQERFGGEIVKVKDPSNISHYWNIIDGVEYDLTKNQYPPETIFSGKIILKNVSSNTRVDILRNKMVDIEKETVNPSAG